MKNVITVKNLEKTYKLYNKPIDRLKESLSKSGRVYHKTHFALNNVSFEVYRGDNVGIVGTNGSGKSTLLKILTGVLAPTSGNVSIEGKISALLELGAGFNQEYTGIENIYLNGTIMGYSREEMEKKIDEILKFADIGEFIYQPVKTYSSGMFARLAFAVAINVEPEILIVDEALSVGDMHFQIKCMNKMKQMMRGGTTVLFVSHDINAIKRFCTKAIWLKSGNLVEYGDVYKVTDNYVEFLKLRELSVEKEKKDKSSGTTNSNIAEIKEFKVINGKSELVNEVMYNEPITLSVNYSVHDKSVVNAVLGIALLGADDEYLCGLNTLLDDVIIPWELGENTVNLEYGEGLRVNGGNYYFNVALFEETATVPIDYYDRIEKIKVTSKYDGEGKFIIPHSWNYKLKEN